MKFIRILVLLVFAVPLCLGQPSSISQQSDDIVATYRRIIILMDGVDSLDPATRERATTLGRMLFEQNLERLSQLSAQLTEEAGKKKSPAMNEFLDRFENNADYRDADKLAFRELFEDFSAVTSHGYASRVLDDLAALSQIQSLYESEISSIFSRFQTRSMPVHREAWDSYLAFIKQTYNRAQILKENESLLPAAETRSGTHKKNRDEIYGNELPAKTILLTFDDGPHPRYTAQILDILKAHNIQAVFFQVGRNLGTVSGDNVRISATAGKTDARLLEEGSSLGNHSFTHALLPKLQEAGYTEEIEDTNKLLKAVLKSNPVLFRPPYGASNAGILALVQSKQEKTMIWNIDSLDWADPVPKSIEQRVLGEVAKAGRGIILFHDIHKRTLEILPDILDQLEKDGYKFASWSGTEFAVPTARGGTQSVSTTPPAAPPYRESWAAIIGIDDYASWPKLRYASHDAEGVRDVLVQRYKFKPDHVFTLLNKDATRQNILSLLGDKLGSDMVKREDRVFVFFAGHGATRKLPSGRDLGYIIPVDADLTNYQGMAISMTNFQDIAETIPAKHVLFVMDSCYSGLAVTRGGSVGNSQNFLQEITRRVARQMFTAGGADQQVADNGPNGHSVFTWTLLQGLDGRADLNGDGIITASELASYVGPAVSALSQQTPAFGNLVGSEGGDFTFDVKHDTEFLNADSAQLNDDAIKLNSELERLRATNLKLERELAAARAGKRPAPPKFPPNSPLALNDEGMRLYKEKKYDEAISKFSKAAELDPKNPLFTNNVGFVFYKMDRMDDAAQWFQKTITIDPNRAVAYLNLGDALAKANKNTDAKQAYEKYLELASNSKGAAEVRDKLSKLPQ